MVGSGWPAFLWLFHFGLCGNCAGNLPAADCLKINEKQNKKKKKI